MKKTIILLLFVPLLLQAQQTQEWLTPFSDVRFEDGKIVYSFCKSEKLMLLGIIPKYYSKSLMKLRTEFNRPATSIEDVARQQEKIREYLIEEQPSDLNQKDREEYLRLSAMVLIWDMELDKQVLSNLNILKRSETPEIEKQTELVLQLEDVYRGLR